MAATLNGFVNSFSRQLEAPVRQHLKNVYGCMSLSALTAAAGTYVHIYTQLQSGLLCTLGSLGLLMALLVTPDNGKNQKQRLAYLLGFAFLWGIGFGPVFQLVVSINPSIIITALLATTLIFVSFSIFSLLATRGSYLYLGGTLLSALNFLMLLSFANIFLGSTLLYEFDLYIGFFLLCGFVVYDTQLIVEKNRMGSKDFISDALCLFVDFISLFRRLVVILTQKEQKSKRKE
jgi:FtsH-binding integral membrane protein